MARCGGVRAILGGVAAAARVRDRGAVGDFRCESESVSVSRTLGESEFETINDRRRNCSVTGRSVRRANPGDARGGDILFAPRSLILPANDARAFDFPSEAMFQIFWERGNRSAPLARLRFDRARSLPRERY